MGARLSRQPQSCSNNKPMTSENPVTPSELTSFNPTDMVTFNWDFFASLPEEIVRLIVSMLNNSSDHRHLTMISRSLRKFFIYRTFPSLSSDQELDPKLAPLYPNICSRFMYSDRSLIPQFLVSNPIQPMNCDMHLFHGLILGRSEKFPSLNLSKLPALLISWPEYNSSQEATEHSMEQISEVLKSQTYPNVKRLALDNFFYSPQMIEFLFKKFNGLEYLNILSFNSKYDGNYELLLWKRVLKELEVTFPISHSFHLEGASRMEKCTINTLGQKPESTSKLVQMFSASDSDSLKSLIINKGPEDSITLSAGSLLSAPNLETLISNTNGKLKFDLFRCSKLKTIYVSKDDRYPFLDRSPNGIVSLDTNLCPNCTEFGLFDEFGKLQIMWRKQ